METTTTIYTGLPLFASSVQMNTRTDYYRPQEKVRFSVNLSAHRGSPFRQRSPPDRDPPPSGQRPPKLTSSGGHCSGRYASYWNVFFLTMMYPLYRGDNNLPLKYISLESVGACIRAHWTKAPTSANVLWTIPIVHEHRWVANIKRKYTFSLGSEQPEKTATQTWRI